MKRIYFFLLVQFLLIGSLQATYFKSTGDKISTKDSVKLMSMIEYQIQFYNKLDTIDSVNFNIKVFDSQSAYDEERTKHKLSKRHATLGFYSSKDTTCYINRAKKPKTYLSIVFHEANHYFVINILKRKPPIWFNEGLSEYFEHSSQKKTGWKFYMSDYELGRIKTMIQLKDLNLKEYISWTRADFIKEQVTNENYSYTLAHAIVYFLLQKDIDQFKAMTLLIKNGDASFNAIDTTYKGGFDQFEKDFTAYYINK
ncbi:MAG: DUF1570 domain-containing protein [Paludibacteraceae bacterium]|nr:DUF1570 domain-containing protein [Paludibacteraceae bacterium]